MFWPLPAASGVLLEISTSTPEASVVMAFPTSHFRTANCKASFPMSQPAGQSAPLEYIEEHKPRKWLMKLFYNQALHGWLSSQGLQCTAC